jgi:hypothetical protein
MHLSGNDPQQGGLPRTVGSHQSDPVPRTDVNIHILEEDALCELERE